MTTTEINIFMEEHADSDDFVKIECSPKEWDKKHVCWKRLREKQYKGEENEQN